MSINIDQLTIAQAREIASLFTSSTTPSRSSITDAYKGKYVIVRSRNEGINAGVLKHADETGCVLSEARRIWYHKPSDKAQAWYEGVANSGLHPDSKLSPAVSEKIIIEDYSITICTEKAEQSIRSHASHTS